MNMLTPARTFKPHGWVSSALTSAWHESPNVSVRATPRHPSPVIDTVVLHYTGGRDLQHYLDLLTNPNSGVSTHYLLTTEGKLIQLVNEAMKAWHAGQSCWAGREDINPSSIGIELLSDGNYYPEAQLKALEAWLAERMEYYDIAPERVLGHHEIAMPPGRKVDVGAPRADSTGFPWQRLIDKDLTTHHCRALPFDGVTPLER